jgi:four helix bundle protein
MGQINSFRDLLVWQKGLDLAVRCYTLARRFPKDDQTVLGYQIRKSSLSIPSNIAEGHSRHSTAGYINHLLIASGSGAELQTQLEVGKRVNLVTEEQAAAYLADAEELGRMLGGLIGSLERNRR